MKKIAVYRTEEGGAQLFYQQLTSIVHCHDVDIQMVTAKDILEEGLGSEVIGLVVPGRSRGQYYRDELGDEGFKKIQDNAKKGMAVLAVCAGSYIFSRKAVWKNVSQAKQTKHCPYPLFEGKAIGPITRLWENGYQANGSTQDNNTTLLSANVVNVRFAGIEKDVSALYWGGGDFKPSHNRTIRTLVHHTDETPAVIEFECGDGRVIFSNIHPEVTSAVFGDIFSHTSKAIQDRDGFAQDRLKLASTQSERQMIFYQFLHNCGLKVDQTRLFPVLTTV